MFAFPYEYIFVWVYDELAVLGASIAVLPETF